jgi:hypothetical protein
MDTVYRVGDTVSRVEDETSGAARGVHVQRQDGQDGDVEGLEHDLAVSLGVEGRLDAIYT